MTAFHMRRGLHADHEAVQRAALDAARASGDAAGEAHILVTLASGYIRSGRFDSAEEHFLQVLPYFEEASDFARQVTIHQGLNWVAFHRDRPADMLRHSLRNQELSRLAGSLVLQAGAANDIGYAYALLGDYEQAYKYCRQGLGVIRDLGESVWEASTWDSLGFIGHKRGNLRQSMACYRTALGIQRTAGDRLNEAITLIGLGDVQESAGHRQAAIRSWEDALRIYNDLGHPDASRARSRLSPDGGQTTAINCC